MQQYHRWMGVAIAASLVSAGLVVWGLFAFNGLYQTYFGNYLIGSRITVFVFVIALVAYLFLAVALLNAVLLFSLSQPKLVTAAIWPALLVNATTSFLLSRWISYEWAVVGLVAGAVVFAFLSYRQVRSVLKRLDYYLFAAL